MKKCNQCGAWIDFVTTQAGRHMPVEPRPVFVRTDRGGGQLHHPGGEAGTRRAGLAQCGGVRDHSGLRAPLGGVRQGKAQAA